MAPMPQRPGKLRVGPGCGVKMSSTYQSFADTGPTYSYLDLSRARSDESLMWNAGEEAAAVVAELRASLATPLQHMPKKPTSAKGQEADDEDEDEGVETSCPNVRLRTRDDISVISATGSVRGSRPSLCGRSLSFTDLQSCTTGSAEDLQLYCFHPPRVPCTAHCLQSPAASPTGSSTSSGHSSFSSGSSHGSGVHTIHGKRHHMRNYGGSWRSLLRMGSMSVRGKPSGASMKKVSPPTVPDTVSLSSNRNSGSSFASSGVYSQPGDQRASYSSSISDDNTDPPPRSPARACDHGQLGGRTSSISSGGGVPNNNANNNSNINNNNSGNNNSPSHFHQNTQFTFPQQPHQVPQFAHLMCPKTSPGSPHHVPPDSTYQYLQYQHQASIEDQGIDVQSPGRSSPGSGSGSSTSGSTASSGGCRNSTTSIDSGRASTSTQATHQHRLSGQSYDSTGSILRHSYHSSSSSLGSMEHDATHVNVPELLNNGVRDSEVLRAWLTDLRMDEYIDKFVAAGYDMPTISRMTPEDLNAIGITKPLHRKKLKAEINRLNISNGLPDFIPGRLEEWLKILRLEEYCNSLRAQKYESVEQMIQITWEDLEDIGISKLGHQKKVMLAIKRVKDIMSGKKFSMGQEPRQPHYGTTHEIMISRDTCDAREQFTNVPEFRTFTGPNPPNYNSGEHPRMLGPSESHYGVPSHYVPGGSYVQAPQGVNLPPQSQFPGVQFSAPAPMPPQAPQIILPGQGPPTQVQYRPDVVAVQVRPGTGRGRGIESMEEPIYGTYQTFHPEQRLSQCHGPLSLGNFPAKQFPPGTSNHPQRSQDDGDITPTNEFAMYAYEGAGTLPRSRNTNKFRPVAKVTAKTRVDVHEAPQFIKPEPPVKPSQDENLMVKTLNRANSEKIYSSHTGTNSTNNTPQGTPKKLPPPPPRRSNSISESTKNTESSRESQYGYIKRGLSYGYMGIKNNLQPDVTSEMPPPPAPNDVGNHQHLPDDFPPPPPPLTCVTMASSARGTSASATITTSSLTSDSLATTQSSTTPSPEAEGPEFRPRRNDSNASFKSTSSTESDSLPFANENAGTIKQRACRPGPPHIGGGLTLDSCNSPLCSPQSSPAVRRKEGLVALRHGPHTITAMPTPPPSSTLPKSNSGSPEATGDVLNDIGNMLANLTDELDAMLEQEMVVKN